MNRLASLALLTILATPAVAAAEATKSHFLTNDALGDGEDRWRSAGFAYYLGYEGERTNGIPHHFRINTQIISPQAPTGSSGPDRPYVGMFGVGAFLNHRIGLTDVTAGGEVAMIGEQTGISELQNTFHDVFGTDGYMPNEDEGLNQVPDAITGMASTEVAMNYYVGQKGLVRPFGGAQYGYETFLRAGVDLMWGEYSYAERFVRDPISGFIQPASEYRKTALEGFSILAGVDYTAVTESDFFPESSGVVMEPGRLRARLGFQAGFKDVSIFYGLTHLTKEFEGQDEGQTVGTISFQMKL